MKIIDLNYFKDVKTQNSYLYNWGGTAISSSKINSVAEGIRYTNIIAESKLIAISLPNYKSSQSFTSVSSVAI